MISIFGPLIGFLSCYAAVIIWLFTREEMLVRYAYLALLLNAFNLLPIVPLDGGHFLNETLFNRSPKAELVFKVLAMLGLACLAYQLCDAHRERSGDPHGFEAVDVGEVHWPGLWGWLAEPKLPAVSVRLRFG